MRKPQPEHPPKLLGRLHSCSMPRAALLLLLFTAPLALARAQAPRITPYGDPSVNSDTIYRLAVNPADYPDQAFVVLLDDGVARFEADGRSTRTYRQVVQVLTQEGVERWGEQSFTYVRGRERLTVNWIRVLRPNGSLVSAEPTHEQESLAPVALQAPVYSDARVRRATLGGVAPGTLVDYSYTIERLQPALAGDFYVAWSVTPGPFTRRSRYIVDLPLGLAARIQQHNVRFAPRTVEAHGRRVLTWATAEVPQLNPEPLAAAPNSVFVSIDVAGSIGWNDVARWYADLARDRYTVTPQLEARFGEVAATAGARTGEDSLRALHRWVAQDFRYVALELGLGGYQPRPAAAVLKTKYGDCKDKATLFIALARHMGLEADPVLLSARGAADSTLPSTAQFDHVIAAVRTLAGYRYFDLTSDLTPFGELPYGEQGSFALVVRPDGSGEPVTLPLDSAKANRLDQQLVGEVSATGTFTGSYTETASGTEQYLLRGLFGRRYSAEERLELAGVLAGKLVPGASGRSLEAFDGRDLAAAPRVSLALYGARITTRSGGTDILTLPIPEDGFGALIPELEAHVPRKYPIDVDAVVGPVTKRVALEITLPEGWRARLPREITASSPFGSYYASYSQDGRTLRVVRELSGNRGVAPPDQAQALITWLRGVSTDDVRFIVLDHGP